MPIVFDITTDELYLEGYEVGLLIGLEKCMRLSLKRWEIALEEIAKYFEVPIDVVSKIKEKIINE
jgi:hypothetical protein